MSTCTLTFVNTPGLPAKQRGVSLVELMIAIAIGLVLVYGATVLYVKSRVTYNDNDAIARLQESGRYALNALEQDIRMSSYWGMYESQSAGVGGVTINGQTPAAGGPVLATATGTEICGSGFAFDVRHPIQGDNDGNLPNFTAGGAGFLSDSVTGNCAPFNNNRVTTADTLTIRHVDPNNAAAAGAFQVCSTLASADVVTQATAAGCVNNGTTGQVNNYQVHAYYVSRDSTQQTGLPSLRRKTLDSAGVFTDEEVIPGVEDMQIQFGIESTANISSQKFTGVASQYVNPDDPILNPAYPAAVQIVTVRVWLLMRGETPEANWQDVKKWSYGNRDPNSGTTNDLNDSAGAGKAYQPTGSATRYRRLLVSRTFQVRNAQTKG